MEHINRIVEISLDITDFASDWAQCIYISEYMAELAGEQSDDPARYRNMMARILNELLEMVQDRHGEVGAMKCAISRAEAVERIELEIPADHAVCSDYQSRLNSSVETSHVRYSDAVSGDGPIDSSVILDELRTDIGAVVIMTQFDDRIRFVIDVKIDGAT